VTTDDLAKAFKLAMQELQAFRENVIKDLTIIHQNHQELLQGLSASEFNLRAHQKVLNAMSLEQEHVVALLNSMGADINKLAPEGDQYKNIDLCTLNMATVQIPQEEGPPKEVRRIDWPYYHEQVKKDLAILKDYEEQVKKQKEEEERLARKAAAERTTKMVEACDNLRATCTELSLNDLADRIEKGEQILKDESLKEFELTGEERSMVVSRLREGPTESDEAKEEAPEAESPEEPPQDEPQGEEFPDGAQIFGG
jgi:hypothetical protein